MIRPASPDDADLLVGWHADLEVARHWDWETFTRVEMVERLARSDVDPYIVLENGEPVGYLQAWFDDDNPDEGVLAMFLISDARHRGLGRTRRARSPVGSSASEGSGASSSIPTSRMNAGSGHGRRPASALSECEMRITNMLRHGS